MFCRNPIRGETARQQVVAQSGNDKVDLIIADLARQQSIREAVSTFNDRHERLDVLINNAANFDITMKKPQLTEDGTETIFATNHLAPFLLTTLLLDRLKASAPARVINVASKGLLSYPFLTIDFDNLNGQKKFSAQHAYYQSKLAQIIFTYDLAERMKKEGVTVNCIRVPTVKLDEGRYDHVPSFLRAIYRFKMRFAITPEAMAQAYVDLATSPDYATLTGQYVDENCQPLKAPRHTQDYVLRQQLWDVSVALTRMSSTPVL
jgi:NAD(P)-dependent dehydrogenase (short-subunit alcohol dehydrogenase family)